jgi:pyruvate formate lyase activating enzyme
MIHAEGANFSWDQVSDVLSKARDEWVDAVCISGGEPCIHKGLKECMQWFKDKGFFLKLDTNGSLPDRLEEVIDIADYIAMDYKSSLDRYEEAAGTPVNTDYIIRSVMLLKERAPGRYEIRTTILTSLHDEKRMKRIGEELQGIEKYIIQPFVPQETVYDPRFRNEERTSAAYLEKMLEIIKPFIPNSIIRGVGM